MFSFNFIILLSICKSHKTEPLKVRLKCEVVKSVILIYYNQYVHAQRQIASEFWKKNNNASIYRF